MASALKILFMLFSSAFKVSAVTECFHVASQYGVNVAKMCYASQASGTKHVIIDAFDSFNSPYTSCQCVVNVISTTSVKLTIKTLAGVPVLSPHCKSNLRLSSATNSISSGCSVSGSIDVSGNANLTLQLSRTLSQGDSRYCIHLSSDVSANLVVTCQEITTTAAPTTTTTVATTTAAIPTTTTVAPTTTAIPTTTTVAPTTTVIPTTTTVAQTTTVIPTTTTVAPTATVIPTTKTIDSTIAAISTTTKSTMVASTTNIPTKLTTKFIPTTKNTTSSTTAKTPTTTRSTTGSDSTVRTESKPPTTTLSMETTHKDQYTDTTDQLSSTLATGATDTGKGTGSDGMTEEEKLTIIIPVVVGVVFLILLFVGVRLSCGKRQQKSSSYQVPDEEILTDDKFYDSQFNGSTLQMKGHTNDGYQYNEDEPDDRYKTTTDKDLDQHTDDVIFDNVKDDNKRSAINVDNRSDTNKQTDNNDIINIDLGTESDDEIKKSR